jgi:hypothetical protein
MPDDDPTIPSHQRDGKGASLAQRVNDELLGVSGVGRVEKCRGGYVVDCRDICRGLRANNRVRHDVANMMIAMPAIETDRWLALRHGMDTSV